MLSAVIGYRVCHPQQTIPLKYHCRITNKILQPIEFKSIETSNSKDSNTYPPAPQGRLQYAAAQIPDNPSNERQDNH